MIPFRLPQQAAQTRQGQAALQQLPVAGNNAMQLPGQTMPGNTAQGGPMLRLAQGQGSAILQTPQAYGGSAQQAPQMQGGIGVLTPPGQGGAALPGQQNQSGAAALQPQQGQAMSQTPAGQAMPQGQQTGGSIVLPVLPNVVLPDDAADPYSAYQQYEQMLGGEMPAGGYAEFLRIRNANGEEWHDLQGKYWCAGAEEAIRTAIPEIVICKEPGDIAPEYLESARRLPPEQKSGIYHYSHYPEGIAMNNFLAGKPGATLTPEEMQHMKDSQSALASMSVPHITLTWRGTYGALLEGFAALNLNDPASWRGKKLYVKRNCSTSILANTAYKTEVRMLIIVPEGMPGAGYIDEISYNFDHEGEPDGRGDFIKREYEVTLQYYSKFVIIQGILIGNTTYIIVKWMGGQNGNGKQK